MERDILASLIRDQLDNCSRQGMEPAKMAGAREYALRLIADFKRRATDIQPIFVQAGWFDSLPPEERHDVEYRLMLMAWKQCPSCKSSARVAIVPRPAAQGKRQVTLNCRKCGRSRTVPDPEWRMVKVRPNAKGRTGRKTEKHV